MSTEPIRGRLSEIRDRIAEACRHYGRDARDVNLLAVTKTVAVPTIRTALAMGQQHFGENYLQEACAKIAAIDDAAVTWHFIGGVQSNKTADIARNFTWVHTVCREKIAQRLAAQRPAHLPPLKVMVQVNVSGESSKAGVGPQETSRLIESMLRLDGLELRGLMTIPAPDKGIDAQRKGYSRLRELKEEIKARYGDDLPDFTDLSMGMSADFEAAIAEGATWLRIGTAIFGARQYKH